MASRQQASTTRGAVARDRSTGRVGEVMGCEYGCIQLRPLGGGVERDVARENFEPMQQDEAISARLKVANARSRAANG